VWRLCHGLLVTVKHDALTSEATKWMLQQVSAHAGLDRATWRCRRVWVQGLGFRVCRRVCALGLAV